MTEQKIKEIKKGLVNLYSYIGKELNKISKELDELNDDAPKIVR